MLPASLLLLLCARVRAEPRGVPVLMYHILGQEADADCMNKGSCRRVAAHCPVPGGGAASPRMIVPVAEFKWEMEYLRDHDYDLLTIDELADRGRPPRRSDVVITFDDGYADNFEAFLVLRQVGSNPHHKGQEFHATEFMVSNNVDCQGRLSADQLREMDAAGFRVEDHSKTHDAAHTVGTAAQQTAEYGESKAELEDVLGRRVDFAAYPYGRFNEETSGVMRALGFKAAFVIDDKASDPSGDPYRLTRFAVTRRRDFFRALGRPGD